GISCRPTPPPSSDGRASSVRSSFVPVPIAPNRKAWAGIDPRTFFDLLGHAADETVRVGGTIAGSAEDVVPLPVRQTAQQPTRPAHVVWRDAFADEAGMHGVVAEVDKPRAHADRECLWVDTEW